MYLLHRGMAKVKATFKFSLQFRKPFEAIFGFFLDFFLATKDYCVAVSLAFLFLYFII